MKSKNSYQECSKCVMDTSDPDIYFDDSGVCSHCKNFEENAKKIWFPNHGETMLEEIFKDVKQRNKKNQYDCILGLSGGLDSSYMCLKLKKYKLRMLAVHVDAGWNSNIAVSNIEKLVKHCDLDLHTSVVDWQSIKELQIAYLESGISNQDVPQDHVFFATLYKVARKNNCNTFLSGGNVATEFIF